MSEPDSDLTELNAAVRRAVEEQRRPPTPEEGVKAIGPVETYLSDDDARAIWRVISLLGREAPETADKYVGEGFLFSTVIRIVEEEDGNVDLARLVSPLEVRASREGRWLVAVPLANALAGSGYNPAGATAGVMNYVQEKDWRPLRGEEAARAQFDMSHHLGDRVNEGVRWAPQHGTEERLDTRRGAVIFQVLDGVEVTAFDLAAARAQYAVAFWTLLKPPTQELWPTLATWTPRPFRREDLHYKIHEPGTWTGRQTERGRNIIHAAEYILPDDPAVLSAPFRAIELASGNAAARAVLTASWALHLVERVPNDLQPSDEFLQLAVAIDAVCDLGVDLSASTRRWDNITSRYGVWKQLDNNTADEIDEAKALARDLRNIATHGGDAALINLGYPRKAIRPLQHGASRTGAELSMARVDRTLPIIRYAVRAVLAQLARELIERDWDVKYFRSQFAGAQASS